MGSESWSVFLFSRQETGCTRPFVSRGGVIDVILTCEGGSVKTHDASSMFNSIGGIVYVSLVFDNGSNY